MKKFCAALMVLILVLGLSACGEKQVTDAEQQVTLEENGKTVLYYGTFTGTLVKKLPEGEGTFKCSEGWTYTGNFTAGAIKGEGMISDRRIDVPDPSGDAPLTGTFSGHVTDGIPRGEGKIEFGPDFGYEGNFEDGAIKGKGTIKNYHLTSYLNGEFYDLVFSGPVTDGMPDGDGILVCESQGWTYEGPFMYGEFDMRGKMRDFPYTLTTEKGKLEGVYNGDILDLLPDGIGSFSGEEGGRAWSYEGGFTEGKFKGAGAAENLPSSLDLMNSIRAGLYTGPVKDGIPDGSGFFESTNPNDVYTYKGGFSNGAADGYGTLKSKNVTVAGNFSAGKYVPTLSQLLAVRPYAENSKDFTVTEEVEKYVAEHPDQFPLAEGKTVNESELQPYDREGFISEPGVLSDRLTAFDAYIIDSNTVSFYGHSLTLFILLDRNAEYSLFYMADWKGEVRSTGIARFTGLPVSPLTLDMPDGSKTVTAAFYGSSVEYAE